MAVDGLKPFAIDRFGGLNLAADPSELGFSGAVDLMNVTVDPGVIRQRDGFSTHVAASSAAMTTLHSTGGADGGDFLVGVGTAVRQYTGTTQVSTTSFPGGGPYGFVNFGTPANELTFVGNGKEPIHRLVGTTWSDGTTDALVDGAGSESMPSGQLLAVTPWDNRLVVTGFDDGLTGGGPGGGGGTSSEAHVWFSDPGDPQGWSTNNFVILRPGDGEAITGICAWQNYVFVFKRTAFFVFTGTSTSGKGTPIFDWRGVYGVGHSQVVPSGETNPQSVCATRDGVYFANETGIYRTTGGPAVEVSQAIRPLFRRGVADQQVLTNAAPLLTSTVDAFSFATTMAWHDERLYISFSTKAGSFPATLVHDPQQDTWVLWDCAPQGFTLHRDAPRLLMFTDHDIGTSTGWNVYYVNRETTTDQGGTAIASWYQSGFSDLGVPAVEKTIRETQVVGTGTVTLGWPREFERDAGSETQVTLGTAPKAGRGLARRAAVGELLSFKLEGTAAYRVNRIVPMLRESRGVGERTHA